MCVCVSVDVWNGMGKIVFICMSIYMHMSTLIIKLMDVLIIYLIACAWLCV